METIRQWSVLDTRTNPASCYLIEVIKWSEEERGGYAMLKKGDGKVSVLYSNPVASRQLAIRHGRRHIKHLNAYSCVVFQRKLANAA